VTAQEVFLWAHGKGVSRKEPSPITIGARIACPSSFFRFLQRMDIVVSNPCERRSLRTQGARGSARKGLLRMCPRRSLFGLLGFALAPPHEESHL
jgi:hypothetical protein